jgi:hypothetical protein
MTSPPAPPATTGQSSPINGAFGGLRLSAYHFGVH